MGFLHLLSQLSYLDCAYTANCSRLSSFNLCTAFTKLFLASLTFVFQRAFQEVHIRHQLGDIEKPAANYIARFLVDRIIN